ncbi:hypothetical protein GPUN_1996 [Glaciecola punicea ACAM 611]|jgi:predicted secreted hydrolase|uniref:AttH domain-containing protein n=1 Tax=Glaciecola punicea ACAM 611 TaxID=1121923 RepID=H5TCT4_9ALTE|nr:lipocalin-like domain-containing protein [Glaciecola punicea]GAB56111.1 hypothetical protein GPUN_1996 [Glaciecola punicea ACAM 611]
MVKLTRTTWLLFACALIILILIALFTYKPLVDEATSSIFGRNVYSADGQIGQVADPDYVINLPQDHGSHALFDIEWWYLTANLRDIEGNPYGLQWTLFRFRNPSAPVNNEASEISTWHNDQMFMAHASVHSLQDHWFSEKFARGGVGNAEVSSFPFTLAIDDWSWVNTINTSGLLPAALNFSAVGKSKQNSTITASLNLQQTGPFVLHGDNGYSIKSNAGHASHYYSAPFIDIAGKLVISTQGAPQKEVEVSGQAWFDQEWTSQLLDDNTLGWDWVSLHLDSGEKVMAFRMRLNDQKDYITGSYMDAAGKQTTLLPSDLDLRPVNTTIVREKEFPLKWRLSIPSKSIDITITSIKDDQYNDASIPYYEGMVRIEGSHRGEGFIELTGY